MRRAAYKMPEGKTFMIRAKKFAKQNKTGVMVADHALWLLEKGKATSKTDAIKKSRLFWKKFYAAEKALEAK